MTIHGIKIIFPHSGRASRGKVITEMVRDMQNHVSEKVTKENLAEMCKDLHFTHFLMQDVNYEIFGSFEMMQNEEPASTCGQCGTPLTKVRPGKHQCDNPMCRIG